MVPINADELMDFSNALEYLDNKGLQVEGKVYVPNVGYMHVEYDGANGTNTVVHLEVDE